MDLTRLSDIFAPSDFAEPASLDPADIYTDAVVHLLARGGIEQISLGAVARHLRQVTSAVHQRAGGINGLLRSVTARFSNRWAWWVSRPGLDVEALVRLPTADDEVHGIRVWSALCELAAGAARAGRPELAEIVAETRRDHRESIAGELAALLRRRPTPVEVTLVDCLGEGLRAGLTAPTDRLDPALAAAVLRWLTDHLRRSE